MKLNKIKLLLLTTTIILLFSLAGCGTEVSTVHVGNTEMTTNIFGKYALEHIGNGLYYDTNTRIVYWWNKTRNNTIPSPYYAQNGLPYRYNPETNTFEEIEK